MPVTGSNDLSTNNSILITQGTILGFLPHRVDTLHQWMWNSAWYVLT